MNLTIYIVFCVGSLCGFVFGVGMTLVIMRNEVGNFFKWNSWMANGVNVNIKDYNNT